MVLRPLPARETRVSAQQLPQAPSPMLQHEHPQRRGVCGRRPTARSSLGGEGGCEATCSDRSLPESEKITLSNQQHCPTN